MLNIVILPRKAALPFIRPLAIPAADGLVMAVPALGGRNGKVRLHVSFETVGAGERASAARHVADVRFGGGRCGVGVGGDCRTS